MIKFIIGLILGVGIAVGIAYYLNNMPNQFVARVNNNNTNINASAPIVLAPGTKFKVASSEAINSVKTNTSAPKFDFYNVLPGESKPANAQPTNNSSAPSKDQQPQEYYIQAGAFTDPNLANDMKARVTLLGYEVVVDAKQDNDHVVNRILVGPFYNSKEANEALQKLKDEKIDASIVNN